MKYAKRNNNKVKKLMFGGNAFPAISTGIGIASSLIGSHNQKRQAKKEENDRINLFLQNKEFSDRLALEDYNILGDTNELYALGGDLTPIGKVTGAKHPPIKQLGGELNPIGDDAVEVDGNTHNENTIDNSYGVTLQDPNTGQPIAEVENDEVIINDYVFSDRLTDNKGVTFAKRAKSLVNKRNKLEEESKNTNDVKKNNSVKRQLQGLDIKERELIESQEILKALQADGVNTSIEHQPMERVEELPIMSGGGKLKKGTGLAYMGEFDNSDLYSDSFTQNDSSTQTDDSFDIDTNTSNIYSKMLPFLDNATNAILTANTPKLSTPILPAYRDIETKVNVAPQVQAIRRGVNTTSDFVKRNTSNSNVARSNIAQAKLRGAEALSDVYATKENTERGLRNQSVQMRNAQAAEAAGVMNNHADRQFARKIGIQGRVSANVANLEEDFKQIEKNRLQDDAYDQELLLAILNDPTISKEDKEGVKLRWARKNPNAFRTPRMRNLVNQ